MSGCKICNTPLGEDLFSAVTGEDVCSICKNNHIGGLPTTPALIAAARELHLRGITEVCGLLEGIGGIRPSARVRVPGEGQVSCSVSREQAQSLAPHLYNLVRLRGTATWEAESLRTISFVVEELLTVNDISVAEAVGGLSELIGPAWDAIEDPDSYLWEHRNEDPSIEDPW